ncbi:MAG: carboxypeptidase-like regulatory domain-containing protein [Bacteroides sp.]|nr:carboxypeptidase-like regulatory domain-containing protein [Bacteroides sp.]
MRQVIILLLLITNIFTSGKVFAQNQLKQAIQGIVIDRSSGAPLPYVTITVLPSSGMRAVTGEDGKFTIERVSIGRHDL